MADMAEIANVSPFCLANYSKVAQTSVFEVCGLSTINQEKAADLHSRSALPVLGLSCWSLARISVLTSLPTD